MNARNWWTVGALWLVALAAVALMVPAWLAGRAPVPAAPGLAGLDDARLAELLPDRAEFPADWRVTPQPGGVNGFGYWFYHPETDIGSIIPAQCHFVAYGGAHLASPAVSIGADARTDRPDYLTPIDVTIEIARDFAPARFDAMTDQVYRCRQFHTGFGTLGEARVLDDTHPSGRPQLFRYAVTDHFGGSVGDKTTQYAYARTAGLVLSGRCIDGRQSLCDRLFAQTLGRIQTLSG